MKSKLLSICKVIFIILIIALSIGMTVFLIKYEIKKKQIQDNIDLVYNIYNNDNSQEIFNEYIANHKEPGIEIENTVETTSEIVNAIAVLEIPAINFKDIVLEGTTQDVLANGIGLFEHSPILNGNVCLAGHNTSRFLKRLNELKLGDTINYLSCLGKKEYVVSDIQIIAETDWSMLEETNDNRITIITCVKNTPEVRLCVQAIEKI